MLFRAVAFALLLAASFGVTTPLVAAAMRTAPRCCHTKACPMMKHASKATTLASCDSEQSAATRGTPAILARTFSLAAVAVAAQTFVTRPATHAAEARAAIEHPPRLFRV
ncbi:MAG TPA: hypothetical protein VJ032_10365 [Thermoanaerobaculia bacterium]|nr:hypothetical protein [Thermoanaerobaculia bacterium]